MPKKRKIKRILIISLVLLVAIVVVRDMVLDAIERANMDNKVYTSVTDFRNVKEIAEYMGCTYIKEEKSSSAEYNLDIYLKFKYPLYTEEVSNEEYYYRMIALMLGYLEYQNIRLIDQENDIVIVVQTDNEKQEITKLLINGKDNYFETQKSLKEISQYEMLNITKLDIESKIINDLISNKWIKDKTNLGTAESTFGGYNILFDEGLEAKVSGGKVLNLVFTEKYTDTIVNGIKVNETKDNIIQKLGEPTFEHSRSSLIGYKGEKIYVFFSENRVSVYPIEKSYENTQYIMLVQQFQEYPDFLTFVSGLTDIWPDYSKYEYSDDYVNIEYVTKGIRVQWNMQNSIGNGIVLYNNYNGSLIGELKQNTEKMANTYYVNDDLVYQYENEMINSVHNYTNAYMQYNANKNQILEIQSFIADRPRYEKDSNKFFVMQDTNTAKIISINNEQPKSEIEDLYTYFWINDEVMLYSIKNKGIYKYNATTRQITTVFEGTNDFYIKDYQNSTIYYDDISILYLEDTNLPTNYNSMIWLDSTNLAYSINNKGIYRYNLTTKETQIIIEGNEQYQLEKYENSRLYYNGIEIIYILD